MGVEVIPPDHSGRDERGSTDRKSGGASIVKYGQRCRRKSVGKTSFGEGGRTTSRKARGREG